MYQWATNSQAQFAPGASCLFFLLPRSRFVLIRRLTLLLAKIIIRSLKAIYHRLLPTDLYILSVNQLWFCSPLMGQKRLVSRHIAFIQFNTTETHRTAEKEQQRDENQTFHADVNATMFSGWAIDFLPSALKALLRLPGAKCFPKPVQPVRLSRKEQSGGLVNYTVAAILEGHFATARCALKLSTLLAASFCHPRVLTLVPPWH